MFYLRVNDNAKSIHMDYRQAWKQFNRQIAYGNHAQILHHNQVCADSRWPTDDNLTPEDFCDGP